MKKHTALLLSLLILTGCSISPEPLSSEQEAASQTEAYSEPTAEAASSAAPSSETTTAAKLPQTASATAETEAAPQETTIQRAEAALVNEDGTLTEEYLAQLERLTAEYTDVFIEGAGKTMPYQALYDFDYDGTPEIVLIFHNGGQGNVPCYIFNAHSGEKLGEFSGFCRDGYTRFSQMYEDTVVHNEYQHSNWLRSESYMLIYPEDGMLKSKLVYQSSGELNIGEYNPTMNMTENVTEMKAIHLEFTGNTGEHHTRLAAENAVTSYGYDLEIEQRGEAVFELYNDYVRLKNAAEEHFMYFPGDYDGDMKPEAFLQKNDGLYFLSSELEETKLSDDIYYHAYKLGNLLVVSMGVILQEVYRVEDGRAAAVEELRMGRAELDYSSLYNFFNRGEYEITHYVYDGLSAWNGDVCTSDMLGTSTSKKYALYTDENGWHEYGSIEVGREEFTAGYGGHAEEVMSSIEAEGGILIDILYRLDGMFIINYRVHASEAYPSDPHYYQKYVMLKPMLDSTGLREKERSWGRYQRALIPEIAVYPEKMYIPKPLDIS